MLALFEDKAPCSHLIGLDVWVSFHDNLGDFVKVEVVSIKWSDLREVFIQYLYDSSEECLVSLNSFGVFSADSNDPGVQQAL